LSITHPAVGKAIRDLLIDNDKPIVVIEAVKLVQAGMHLWCDALWAVDCDSQYAVDRVMRTRNMSAADARARLAAQGSFEPQKQLAHVVIDNSGDLDATRAQAQQAWSAIQAHTARDKSEWLAAVPRVAEKPSIVAPPVIETPSAPIMVTPEPAPPIKASLPIEPPPAPVASKSIEVRRSRRTDLDALAVAIAKKENRETPLTREDALKRFGERGYRIAVSGKHIVALVAWEAENLVATVREIWADSADDAALSLARLLELVESEARDLLCEAAILMVDRAAPEYVIAQLSPSGYTPTELATLHPVWRQVVQDRLQPGEKIWGKQLREQIATNPF